jgi:hypothetical protein
MSSPRHYAFMLLLPIVWAVISLIHFRFPGDEYALWATSSIVGTWPCFFIQVGDINNSWLLWMVALNGGLLMAGAGWVQVRLRVAVWLWVGLFVVAGAGWFAFQLQQYPSVERALAKNGSWWAYLLSSCLMGMYSAWVLSLFCTLLIRWAQRRGNVGPQPSSK